MLPMWEKLSKFKLGSSGNPRCYGHYQGILGFPSWDSKRVLLRHFHTGVWGRRGEGALLLVFFCVGFRAFGEGGGQGLKDYTSELRTRSSRL